MTNANEIHESFSADYTTPIHRAMRADGVWFERMRVKDIRYGWVNTAWRALTYVPQKPGMRTSQMARLPRTPVAAVRAEVES